MSVLGIDPSVSHPAFALYPECKTWQLQTRGEGAARLDDLFVRVRGWTAAHIDELKDDLDAVFIERPTGQFPNPALVQANGIIQVAVIRGLAGYFPHPLSCFEISPGTWKKEALGSGRAKKDDVAVWAADRIVDRDLTQDEADALAIACAGGRLVARNPIEEAK